ncbi:MAG: S1/P1 Nuclease [Cytophagales bacterium]|nr:MAG: S1/P1 Nuclease [Cytophagales bacterium]
MQSESINAWGFYAHQKINYYAIFALPPEMIVFYKYHIGYISSHAVDPDKRRYLVKDEPTRHYIDLDEYGDSLKFNMPLFWNQALQKYSEDSLKKHGIVPWHVYLMKVRLTEAFKDRDVDKIIKLSADIGHYIADAHVPLHTTKNYNGQFTNQVGIHGLWESRIPEIYGEQYSPWVGSAQYLEHPQKEIWDAVYSSHRCLKQVFEYEKEASKIVSEDRKFSFEERNASTVRVFSKEFSEVYNSKLQGQVEDRFLKAIKLLSCFWLTAWVDAGQPDLNSLLNQNNILEEQIVVKTKSEIIHDCNEHYR